MYVYGSHSQDTWNQSGKNNWKQFYSSGRNAPQGISEKVCDFEKALTACIGAIRLPRIVRFAFESHNQTL
jgi:hypothetical protein